MLLFFVNIICNYYKREIRLHTQNNHSYQPWHNSYVFGHYHVIISSYFLFEKYTIHFYHRFLKAVCDGECLNGGECRKVDPYLPPKCVCTANFTGNYCEKRKYLSITLLVNRRICIFFLYE